MRPLRVPVIISAIAALLGVTCLAPTGYAEKVRPATPSAQLRLDQLGYLPHEVKQARLMTARRIASTRFRIIDRHGDVVLRGQVPARPVGSWSSRYQAVYRLTFSRLTAPGRYHLVTSGGVTATSPQFRIGGPSLVYGTLVRSGLRFDQSQRDGLDVIPGTLHRRPAHRHDRRAAVYAWPSFVPGSDTITDHDLTRIGGPVDVAGGWFDAGDYLKFTHSTAYNDVLLFFSASLVHGRSRLELLAEARHGLRWLTKMWRPREGVLYLQVGIGSGNQAGTFHGDHDGWRLPQRDDHVTARLDRYVAHRPVFAANRPHRLISPNLVGRVSAAFALGALADARSYPARARRELRLATSLYARARTARPPKTLVTALPHAFYPEDSWRDDMELGAAEIALASRRLGYPARRYVGQSATWASGYLHSRDRDSLNLYDTSALAHVALAEAMRRTGSSTGLPVTRTRLVKDLRRQLGSGVRRAHRDPFAAGGAYDEFDVNSHTFGLVATAGLYQRLTGRTGFGAFATAQRNWLLGENPWGVTAMVGVGSTFPHCMQHQIANLVGSTDGSPPVDVGAVVNGPNDAHIFAGGLGGYQDGMVRCPGHGVDPYRAFSGRGSRYVDDVRSWQTDEPALDMTGAAIIAGAAQLALGHRASDGVAR